MALPKCHISGYVYDAKGDAAADVAFYVHLIIKDGKLIHDELTYLTKSSTLGFVEFDLPRDCVALISASVVGFPDFPSPSLDSIPHKTQGGQAVTIPDAATANLEDLLPALNAPSTAVSQSAFNSHVTTEEAAIAQGDADTLQAAKDYTDEQIPDLSSYATQADLTANSTADRARSDHTGTQAATTIDEDSTHRFVTDAEKATWNAGGAPSIFPVAATETTANQPLIGLPTIDGYQTRENNTVNLLAQDDPIENGPWVVHELSTWERPAGFSGTLPSGMLIFNIPTDTSILARWTCCYFVLYNYNATGVSFNGEFDNSLLQFIVGVDPIHYYSLPANMLSRTDGASVNGVGHAMLVDALDLNTRQVTGLPAPDPAVAEVLYVDESDVVKRSNG